MEVFVASVGELQGVGCAERPECSLAPLEDRRCAYRGELGGAFDQACGDQDVDAFLGWLGYQKGRHTGERGLAEQFEGCGRPKRLLVEGPDRIRVHRTIEEHLRLRPESPVIVRGDHRAGPVRKAIRVNSRSRSPSATAALACRARRLATTSTWPAADHSWPKARHKRCLKYFWTPRGRPAPRVMHPWSARWRGAR